MTVVARADTASTLKLDAAEDRPSADPQPGDFVDGLVSVVIPFLNAERFLDEAIESVLSQTYSNWELLLVDDGSTDRSGEIARARAASMPNQIRYLTHPGGVNRGIAASRNLGLMQAAGEFHAPLDADDVWLPHKLERQVGILRDDARIGLVYGKTKYWRSWAGDLTGDRHDSTPPLPPPVNSPIAPPRLMLTAYPLGSGTAPCPSDLLLRTALARQVGGFEESFTGSFGLYEDQAFLAKVYLVATVFAADECWTKYRLHDESCVATVTRSGESDAARRYFLKWLGSYLEGQHVEDPAIRRALRRAWSRYRHPRVHRVRSLVRSLSGKTRVMLKGALRVVLPRHVTARIRQWRSRDSRVPLGLARFGALKRITPVSRRFGFDRGLPIDRYYIERFLQAHAEDIRGRVLEVGTDRYTRRFGGSRISQTDILYVTDDNPRATIIGDASRSGTLPAEAFDCIVLTQTLQYIYDIPAAVREFRAALKPGGVLLATTPCISQFGRGEWGHSWYWNLTPQAASRLFGDVFGQAKVRVSACGNVLTASAFLQGMAAEELSESELARYDPDYPLLVCIRALRDDTD